MFRSKRKQARPLTQFEAIDLLTAIMIDLQENRYGRAMSRIGMNPDLFDDKMSVEDLAGVFQVRLIELAKTAGVPIDTEGN